MRSRLAVLVLGISILAAMTACHRRPPVAKSTPPPTVTPPTIVEAPRRETPAVAPRTEPPATTPVAAAPPSSKQLENYLNQLLDAYFDYNEAELRSDAFTALNKNSETLRSLLRQSPDAKFVVAGHCDERGSAEYNLALGERRAQAAREFLIKVGVPEDRLSTISYGKDRPVCSEHDEACWQKNRRAYLSAAR